MLARHRLEVHLGILKRNIQVIRHFIGNRYFCPVVKSNAYGLGAAQVTALLLKENILEVGVFETREAEELEFLKSRGLKILILGPIITSQEASVIAENKHWIPVISSKEDLELFSKAVSSSRNKRPIHLKFDIGMSRLGFNEEDIPGIQSFLKNHSQLELAALCGHLPSGFDVVGDGTYDQIKKFKNICHQFSSNFPDLKNHLFNSLSLLGCLSNSHNIEFGLRLGGLMYGIKHKINFSNQEIQNKWSQVDVQEVASLKSYIATSRKARKGQSLSYESSWKAPRDSHIGIVPLGYGQGFWRKFSNQAFVLVRGQKVPVIGHVCMDVFMVDLTNVPSSQKSFIQEEVVIYGKQKNSSISISQWAEIAQSIPYEVMTNMAHQTERVYID